MFVHQLSELDVQEYNVQNIRLFASYILVIYVLELHIPSETCEGVRTKETTGF